MKNFTDVRLGRVIRDDEWDSVRFGSVMIMFIRGVISRDKFNSCNLAFNETGCRELISWCGMDGSMSIAGIGVYQ